MSAPSWAAQGWRAAAAGVVGLVAASALLACSARPQASQSPAAPSGDPRAEADPRAEIAALDRQIADELARAHLAPPTAASCAGPACAQAMATPFTTPTTHDAACHPAATERCTDACTISTSICRNQDKICALAQQLPGDDWAANKCASARTACEAAHDNCCSCVL